MLTNRNLNTIHLSHRYVVLVIRLSRHFSSFSKSVLEYGDPEEILECSGCTWHPSHNRIYTRMHAWIHSCRLKTPVHKHASVFRSSLYHNHFSPKAPNIGSSSTTNGLTTYWINLVRVGPRTGNWVSLTCSCLHKTSFIGCFFRQCFAISNRLSKG